jgi:hypothetical protein
MITFNRKNNVLIRNKMKKSYTTFVNGPACSYAKLKTYANCARVEKPTVSAPTPAPAPVAPVPTTQTS